MTESKRDLKAWVHWRKINPIGDENEIAFVEAIHGLLQENEMNSALLDLAEEALEKIKSMNFVHVVDLKNWEHQAIAKEALEEIRNGRGK